jgi:dethiobiotin synthetase
MKQMLFITGTDTDTGKTLLTALLTRFLRERGVHAAALKPVCSGTRADARALRDAGSALIWRAATCRRFPTGRHVAQLESADLSAHSKASHCHGALTLDEINPWHFRAHIAPLLAARKENQRVKLSQVFAHARAMQKHFEVLLVEGAGGLLSPLGENFNSRDLILALRAIPIIVAQNKLGVVNQILLTLEALPKNLRAKARVVLMSPLKPDASAKTNSKLLAEFTDAKIFSLPWLGRNFPRAEVLKNPKVKRTLAALSDASQF